MNRDQETLGRYLKRERESHRVSIQEIAHFVGVNSSLIDALEADDFDVFTRRSECARLVREYADYLKLNQAQVLKLFSGQWKLSGGVKRFPKLTQFADGDVSPVKSAVFKGKRSIISHLPTGRIWLSIIAVALIAMSVLVIDLLDTKWEIGPADYLLEPEPEMNVPLVKDRVSLPAADAKGRITSTKKIAVPEAPHSPAEVAERETPRHLLPADAERKTAATKKFSAPEVSHPSTEVAEKKVPPHLKGSVVIGNRDSKRYHLPGMRYYNQVKAYHRVVFQSEREAIRAGYHKARE